MSASFFGKEKNEIFVTILIPSFQLYILLTITKHSNTVQSITISFSLAFLLRNFASIITTFFDRHFVYLQITILDMYVVAKLIYWFWFLIYLFSKRSIVLANSESNKKRVYISREDFASVLCIFLIYVHLDRQSNLSIADTPYSGHRT